jgi:arginase family enzyme
MPIVDASGPRAGVCLSREDLDPDVLIVGVPSSKASPQPSRADLTPMAVRDRLSRFSTFHGETGVDFGAVKVKDVGNWAVSELDMHRMPEAVEDLARDLPQVDLTLFVGGDNAIARPLIAAMGADLSRVGLVTFDALIREQPLPGPNVVQIGIHSFSNSAADRAYCDETGIGVFTASDIETEGMGRVIGQAFDRLEHCDRVFVNVDLGVLDRVFAPACPEARPGGLVVRQLAEGVRLCSANRKTRAMDFVGVDSTLDLNGTTIDATAHLLLTAVAGFAGR